MSISLQQLIQSGQSISVNDLGLSANRPLLMEIQTHLCQHGLLDPVISGDTHTPFRPVQPASGKLTLDTRNALLAFHQLANLHYVDNLLTSINLEQLLNLSDNQFLPIQLSIESTDSTQTKFAKRILRYMVKKGYWIARAPDMCNIVYVEGVNTDGYPNDDRLNEWNDRRIVIQISEGGQPIMQVNDQATTEPGRHYTQNPLNRLGAARIAFGQYKAWVDGLHKGKQPALVQAGQLRLHRDRNKDGKRSASDPIDIGSSYGINQHTTSAVADPVFVDKFSAGCMVGRRYRWHLSFMAIVQKDFRYLMNKGYIFMSTFIDGDDLKREEND